MHFTHQSLEAFEAPEETPKQVRRARLSGKASHVCPHCGQHTLVQTTRRSVDRFIGLFVNLRRYRCNNVECGWEGNLIKSRWFRRSSGSVPRDSQNWLMIAANSVLILIIVLLLVALVVGWVDGSLEGAEGIFHRSTETVE